MKNIHHYYNFYDSIFGKVLIGTQEELLSLVQFGPSETDILDDLEQRGYVLEKSDLNKEVVASVLAVIEGQIEFYDKPCAINGTPFQREVEFAISKISCGEVKTYAEIAEVIGNPNAVRAVGSACKNNHLAVIIPCHRVIPSNSKTIGNYRWGQDMKRTLLEREGILKNKKAGDS